MESQRVSPQSVRNAMYPGTKHIPALSRMVWLYLIVNVLIQCAVVFAAVPDSLTPSLSIMSPYDTVTNHYVGQKSVLEMSVAFPAGTTAAVIVELLPSTNVTVMALGNVAITQIGSNLGITNKSVVYHSAADVPNNGFKALTRGVFNFNDVVNSGASTTYADSEIKIQFEAFVLTTDNVNDGDTHWVSTGVEYNNSYNVWIGQTSYVIKTGANSYSKVSAFNMTPSANMDMEVGSTLKLTLSVIMPYPSPDVAVEAISLHDDLSNTDLRVISLVLVDAGSNFEPGLDKSVLTSIGTNCSEETPGSRRVRLTFPTILTNKESYEAGSASENDALKFEALVYLKPTATIGETYPIGLGVEVDLAEVWVSYLNVTSVAPTPTGLSVNFNLDAPNHNSSAYIGSEIVIEANLSIPETGVIGMVLEIETREKTGSTNPGFRLVEVKEKEKGQNVLCSSFNITYTKSDPAGTGTNAIDNKAVIYMTVTNFGTYTSMHGTEANNYTLTIRVVPLPGIANLNSVHTVAMSIDGGAEETMDFSVDGTAPYDQSVGYNFTFNHNCTKNKLTPGSFFEFLLDIKTEQNTNPGPITVEFPVPTNSTESFFSVCGYEILSIGSNIACAIPSLIDSASQLTTLTAGEYKKVKLVFPGSCNLGLSNDEGADVIKIRMLTQVRSDMTVAEDEDKWFGIGSTYSPTQVWVAQYAIGIRAPEHYPGLAVVNGISLDKTDLAVSEFPGIYGIEMSIDGTSFTEKAINWLSQTGNSTHSVYAIQDPFIVSYVYMKHTTACNFSCYIDHEFIVTDLADYIEIFNDHDGNLLRNFSTALDKNNATCFDLPSQGNLPPLFWARLNMTLLEVSFNKFEFLVVGEGISCNRHGGNRVLQVTVPDKFQVSYSTSSSVGKFHGDIKFCQLVYDGALDTPKSVCKYQCACPDPTQCEEAFLFLANAESPPSTPWRLCEISALNF